MFAIMANRFLDWLRGGSKPKQKKTVAPLISSSAYSSLTRISTEDSAMSVATVYRCVAVISETIAQLDGDIIQKKATAPEIKTDHVNQYLLFNRPDLHVSSFVFRRQLVYNYLLTGNGYAIIHRDEDMRPERYEIVVDMDIYLSEDKTIKLYYDKRTGIHYDSSDIIHLADLGPNEIQGKSRITQHAYSIGKAKASSQLTNKLYTNGLNLGGTIEYPENVTLSDPKRSEMSAQIKQNYGGVDNTGKVLILDQGGKFNTHEAVMSLQDAEFIAGEHLSIEDICRIFGVPPFKVFHFNKMTYDNMEAMKVDFVESCIVPIVTQFEQELNFKAFTYREARSGYCVRHNIKSLLRADIRAQADYLKATFSIGKYTINEIRAMDDQPPVEGGDTPFIQVNNYMPLDMVQDYAQAMIDAKRSKVNKSKPKKE